MPSERPIAGSAGTIASIAKALSAISPASITVISRAPGRFTPSWERESNMGARLLADCRQPCNSAGSKGTKMIHSIHRRAFLGSASALAAAMTIPLDRAMAQAAAELPSIAIPPPITSAERLQRIAKARRLMARHRIGAIIIEPGASLDYFTGVQWWRSERLTAAVIPAQGDPIIVTPFFEKPSVEESLGIPAEVRVWQEHEEPLKLVADFLTERGLAGQPVGFEETNRYFILDRLRQQLRAVNVVSANPVVRAMRMIKSPAELALMQAAADINVAALRSIHPRIREGMTPGDIDGLYRAAITAQGASTASASSTATRRTIRAASCSAPARRPSSARCGRRCGGGRRSPWRRPGSER